MRQQPDSGDRQHRGRRRPPHPLQLRHLRSPLQSLSALTRISPDQYSTRSPVFRLKSRKPHPSRTGGTLAQRPRGQPASSARYRYREIASASRRQPCHDDGPFTPRCCSLRSRLAARRRSRCAHAPGRRLVSRRAWPRRRGFRPRWLAGSRAGEHRPQHGDDPDQSARIGAQLRRGLRHRRGPRALRPDTADFNRDGIPDLRSPMPMRTHLHSSRQARAASFATTSPRRRDRAASRPPTSTGMAAPI